MTLSFFIRLGEFEYIVPVLVMIVNCRPGVCSTGLHCKRNFHLGPMTERKDVTIGWRWIFVHFLA